MSSCPQPPATRARKSADRCCPFGFTKIIAVRIRFRWSAPPAPKGLVPRPVLPTKDDSMATPLQDIPVPDKYAWQFSGLFEFGWAVGPGWRNTIIQVVQFVDALITEPADRTIFTWLQIKEKFGGLRMHARFEIELNLDYGIGSSQTETLAALGFLLGSRLSVSERYGDFSHGVNVSLTLPPELRGQILERIRLAEVQCATQCEICGEPGTLNVTGYRTVRCANHKSGSTD